MAKPIALLYFPENFISGHDKNWVYDLMSALNGEDYTKMRKFEEKWQDYLWFVFYKEGITEPELQVFHKKNWTDAEQAELKDLILNSLDQQMTQPEKK